MQGPSLNDLLYGVCGCAALLVFQLRLVHHPQQHQEVLLLLLPLLPTQHSAAEQPLLLCVALTVDQQYIGHCVTCGCVMSVCLPLSPFCVWWEGT